MSRLILVRHAAPLVDPSRPSAQWDLSEDGRRAARDLAAKLARFAPASIFTGPEPKQRQTGEELAEFLSIPMTVLPDLAEHQRRSTSYVRRDQFEDSIRGLFAEPERVVYGDESGEGTYARFADAVDRALAGQGTAPVAAVSGGTAISLFVSRRSRIEPFALWKSLTTPTALIIDRETWAIEEILTL